MILLADLIDRYRSELEQHHGHQLLPSHHRALQAMRRCRNQHSRVMVLECNGGHHQVSLPHSCGHRSCPHCQHHESQQWLERQKAKLLAVDYFMVTFTVPTQLRGLFWANQRIAYDLLLKTAWQTVDCFARRDPQLQGRTGAHAVLHTHERNLDYHPHVHLIVPAGAINMRSKRWQQKKKKEKVLFWAQNLSHVFRAKWFAAMRSAGLHCEESLPDQWVAHCKKVGRGQQALIYLGRYLYRGVLPEKKIIADRDGIVSFCYQDNKGKRQVRTLPGGEFLWLLLKHVLPRRFRRVRDFGILHANAKRLIQLLQLALHMRVAPPEPLPPHPPVHCDRCGAVMSILARMVQVNQLSQVNPLRLC
jgi:hypothetical protein